MDKVIVGMYKDEDFDQLAKALEGLSIEELSGYINGHIFQDVFSGDQCLIIRAVFQGCGFGKNLSALKLGIFLHCLKLLASPNLSSSIATDIVGILLVEVDKLSSGALVDVMKNLTKMVQTGDTGHGCALQVLPKILVCLEHMHVIHLGSGQGSMPGYEYKKHVISNLFACKWATKSVIHLANVFKDVTMTRDEMVCFLTKMLSQLERLDIQAIPPLVHQILPLGGRVHNETILRGIFSLFKRLEANLAKPNERPSDDVSFWDEIFVADENGGEGAGGADSKNLRMVEGTVLLHLTNTARWDQSLGKAFIKMLKLTKDALSEDVTSKFFLALALGLAQINCFQDEVLNHLKAIVFCCFRHEHKQVRSNWLRLRGISSPDIEKALLSVVEACKHGWEQVVTGIVLLGFSLMDGYGPRLGAFGRQIEPDTTKSDTPQKKCCDLGARLLAAVFKGHPTARTEIVERILDRIISNTSSPVYHYIDVLKEVAKKYPTTLLESKQKLREFLDCLCLLSPQNADCVLKAILPLLKINGHLKDSLILMLRKALFSCQLKSRSIACNGFLLLLQNFKVDGSVSLSQASSQCSQSIFSISSQIQVDVNVESQGTQSANHESLCLEVLSTLRRCLVQQAAIRSTLYGGLWNVITRNPHLAGPILEKLQEQFGNYYEEHEGMIPPLKTNCCIAMQNGEPALLEPLPLLMSSLFLCFKKAQEANNTGEDEDPVVDEGLLVTIDDIFKSLTRRMVKSEMEDFELDKSADFSMSTSTGKKNCILGSVVMGCCEVLIEYNFVNDDFIEESAHHILQLFELFKKIKNTLHGGCKDAMKSLPLIGISSPSFVKRLLDGMFCDESPDREAGLQILRGSDDFVKYALNVALSATTHMRDQGFVKGIGGNSKSIIQDCCITVGNACLHKFMQEKSNAESLPIAYSCINIFHICLQYVMQRKRKRLKQFLSLSLDAGKEGLPSTGLDIQAKHISRFQRIVISYISGDVSLPSGHRKILPVLVAVLDTLSSEPCNAALAGDKQRLPRSSTPFPGVASQMNEWVAKLCAEQVIDDAVTTKCLFDLHFRLSSACGPWTGADKVAQGSEGAIRDVVKDIHHVCGDAEPEEEESMIEDNGRRGTHYTSVYEYNIVCLVPLVVAHIDLALDETDLLLQRLKGQAAALLAGDKTGDSLDETVSAGDEEFHHQRQKVESAICVRLGILLASYRELIQTSLPLGNPSESVLKGLSKLFSLLTTFAKYYIWLVTQNITKAPPAKFEKLIKLSGSEVTRYVYPFISFLENLQSSRSAHDARKRKKGDADKDNITTASKKAQVLRETRSIPPLIYAIENLERFLILLGKKCKADLLSGHKLPTSRDFRIKSAVIKEALALNQDSIISQESATTEDHEDSLQTSET